MKTRSQNEEKNLAIKYSKGNPYIMTAGITNLVTQSDQIVINAESKISLQIQFHTQNLIIRIWAACVVNQADVIMLEGAWHI